MTTASELRARYAEHALSHGGGCYCPGCNPDDFFDEELLAMHYEGEALRAYEAQRQAEREEAYDAHASQMQDWLDELRSQVIDPNDDAPLQYSPRPIVGLGSGEIDDGIPF